MQKVIELSLFSSSTASNPNPIQDDFVCEDGEQTEFVMPALEPEESETESITYHDSHRRAMDKIFNWFPHKFQVDDDKWLSEAHIHFGYKSSTPRFIINPVFFNGSYLDTPVWPNEELNTGIFPFSTRFPRGPIPPRHGYCMKPPWETL